MVMNTYAQGLAAFVKTTLNFTSARLLALSLLLPSILLFTGCQTVSSSHTQEIGGPRYSASNPAQVQILRTPPERAHVRLGEVRVQPSSKDVDASRIEDALRKEAAQLGADAVVVVHDHTQLVGAQITGGPMNRSVDLVERRNVYAVAIKYL
jgi:hypothetical protein